MRQEQGLSLRPAARDIGVDPSYLSRVESGTRNVTGDMETRISDFYGLDRDMLDLAAGRVPQDIVEIIRRHPDLIAELRRGYAS
jgi:transcriptional regulator with XRE-family HTH domain